MIKTFLIFMFLAFYNHIKRKNFYHCYNWFFPYSAIRSIIFQRKPGSRKIFPQNVTSIGSMITKEIGNRLTDSHPIIVWMEASDHKTNSKYFTSCEISKSFCFIDGTEFDYT